MSQGRRPFGRRRKSCPFSGANGIFQGPRCCPFRHPLPLRRCRPSRGRFLAVLVESAPKFELKRSITGVCRR